MRTNFAPDRWYVVLLASELPRDRPVGVTRLGHRLVFWRGPDGAPRAALDDCPHRGAALSLGRVVDGCVECPFHGFRFDATGACTLIPANGADGPIPKAMRTRAFPVVERAGYLWLWYGEPPEALPPVPWFEELDHGYAHHTFADDWDTHLTRAVENQLDFTHLPFAHRTTIGRGLPGRLDVLVEAEGDRIKVRYDPATYDAKGFFVELVAPNLWRNRLADGVWVVAVFAPVDAGRTRLYLRFYQRFLTVPLLGTFACWASNLFNRYVLWQDKRIVLTQEPRETALRMGEVLVPSDRPIVAYRRWLDAHPPRELP